jgi:hypothetical protein
MPMWDIPCECGSYTFTYGKNKLFFEQAGRVKFICLLTGTINNVNLSEDLCITEPDTGIFNLNYPHLLKRHDGLRFGILTETPVKCYFSSNAVENESNTVEYVLPSNQESRRCVGAYTPCNFEDPNILVLLAQKSDGDINIGDFYAAVDLKAQTFDGLDERECFFEFQNMDDYFLVVKRSTFHCIPRGFVSKLVSKSVS